MFEDFFLSTFSKSNSFLGIHSFEEFLPARLVSQVNPRMTSFSGTISPWAEGDKLNLKSLKKMENIRRDRYPCL